MPSAPPPSDAGALLGRASGTAKVAAMSVDPDSSPSPPPCVPTQTTCRPQQRLLRTDVWAHPNGRCRLRDYRRCPPPIRDTRGEASPWDEGRGSAARRVRRGEARRGDTGTPRFTPPCREQPRIGLVTMSGEATPLRGGAARRLISGGATRQARGEEVRRSESVERRCGGASPWRNNRCSRASSVSEGAARRHWHIPLHAPFREQPRIGLVTTSGEATPLRGGAAGRLR